MLNHLRRTDQILELETERATIVADLDTLDVEREDLRLSRYAKLQEYLSSGDDRKRPGVNELDDKIARLDERIRQLRGRRREIDYILVPFNEPHAVDAARVVAALIAGVEMPADLAELQTELSDARAARQAHISIVQPPPLGFDPRNHNARLGEIEETIRILRIQRAERLGPYDRKVDAALSPVVRDACEAMVTSAASLIEALELLCAVNAVRPNFAGGVIGRVAEIKLERIRAAGEVASALSAAVKQGI